MLFNEKLRNIAIIAHVDHGKTSLVDNLLRQSGTFRSNETMVDCVMDSNDLERERGITILSKNTAIHYGDMKINIVDTPGHADFGGEVERVLKMVNGVLLVIDASEGPMPQTRFVLKKALELHLKPIVVINKIDRPDHRLGEVEDEILDLFIDLGADEELLEYPTIYASAKLGYATKDKNIRKDDMEDLFQAIIKNVPAPECPSEDPFQMLVSTIEYDEYVGRIAIGRIERGTLRAGNILSICRPGEVLYTGKTGRVYTFMGLKRTETEETMPGDLIAIAGYESISIGDTLADANTPEALEFVDIDEPTISMDFCVNNSPFAGREGDFVTSRHLRGRLFKELETNVSMRINETDSPDTFEVMGRGELHLSILMETMRRQGYEFQVSRPKVIIKEKNGVKYEPVEDLTIDIPEEYMGVIMDRLGVRKAEMKDMSTTSDGRLRIVFRIPSRGLIGYRSQFMTDTKGNGTMNHIFHGYEVFKGEVPERQRGSLVAFEQGTTTTFGLYNAQERGDLFAVPGEEVYAGMVVGINAKTEDIDVNVCKKKHVSNMRASGSDDALKLIPPLGYSMEQYLEYISNDELLEVTPKTMRVRKRILNNSDRVKSKKASLA